MVCGMVLAFQVARTMNGKSAQERSRLRISSVTACKAEGTSLMQRRRCDNHGFAKGDPEFDVTNASSLGASVTVEFKKRPSGVMRYTHGADGKGALVVEMQEKSRYPGDPKGQAAIGGVQKNMVIKSIAGQQCLDWSFIDIMDLLDDYEFQATDLPEAKEAWKTRARKYQPTELPVTVEFVECQVNEVDEDSPVVKQAGLWYPRSSGFTEAQLDQELARAKASSPPPAGYSGVVYSGPSCLNDAWIQAFIEQQKQGILLPKAYAYHLVIDAIKALSKQNTMGEITVPPGGKITVCGDTHGQYWDTMNLFKINGIPSPSNPYVFNGDFVDRGSWGMENVLLLYAMKVKDPAAVFLNRGNHELIEANLIYGFAGECMKKYDEYLFDLFSESFRKLSLCHLINKEIFCCHGGLPGPNPRFYMPGMSHDPSDALPVNVSTLTLAQIAAVDRETELQSGSYKAAADEAIAGMKPGPVSDERIVIDLMWADPRGTPGYGPSYRKSKGIFMFGPDVTEGFCRENNLKYVIRSHEVKEFGWKQDHPQLYTVFSAPDYMDTGGNKGAFMTVANNNGTLTVTPTEFEKTEHPQTPPMIWQSYFVENYPHLTKKMKKKTGPIYDSNGMLVELSQKEKEARENEWVDDDEDGNIDGVAPGATLTDKVRA